MLSRLYAIVNIDAHPDPIAYSLELYRAGVRLIQLRYKGNSAEYFRSVALAVSRERNGASPSLAEGSRLIINDNIELAAECGADGVHLGQEDCSIADARRMLKKGETIGYSTHNLQQALAAEREGADYIGVGPVFKSQTKTGHAPEVGLPQLSAIVRSVRIPTVAIGGITEENCASVFACGVTSVAVISALQHSTDREKTVSHFLSAGSLTAER